MDVSGHSRTRGFSVSPGRTGAALVLRVAGDLDAMTAPTLVTHLDIALADAPPVVVVDMTDVEFLSSAGISVLVETHRLAERADISLRVVADGPATSRPFRMMRLDEVIDLYPTLADAMGERQQGRPPT
ncbi:STAS domain-containing protein [Mycolicibacterium austroafricanum]|uniref:STAS domain-containing protein n=1 Tax=Mycolicibacterium austroafricanum TaxID=39687 RepID=UPI001CA300C6|nr:STAS domain-containing protein [Mycolicibacterium austroafricanum]QZT63475.1 STAS domain-containing protein [Mycolicibacterium austroafricanum]